MWVYYAACLYSEPQDGNASLAGSRKSARLVLTKVQLHPVKPTSPGGESTATDNQREDTRTVETDSSITPPAMNNAETIKGGTFEVNTVADTTSTPHLLCMAEE